MAEPAGPHDPDGGPPCPCGSGRPGQRCCLRYLHGGADPATAEQLMRSRYTAFAVGAPAYLLATWHPSTRPATLTLDPATRWVGLTVETVEAGDLFDDTGTVAFRARFERRGQTGEQAETSRFVREGGRWCYVGPVVARQGSGRAD